MTSGGVKPGFSFGATDNFDCTPWKTGSTSARLPPDQWNSESESLGQRVCRPPERRTASEASQRFLSRKLFAFPDRFGLYDEQLEVSLTWRFRRDAILWDFQPSDPSGSVQQYAAETVVFRFA